MSAFIVGGTREELLAALPTAKWLQRKYHKGWNQIQHIEFGKNERLRQNWIDFIKKGGEYEFWSIVDWDRTGAIPDDM